MVFFSLLKVPLVDQAAPIGSPHALPGHIMLSPTSMPPGGAPFIPTEFDHTKLAPGKTFIQRKIAWIFATTIRKGDMSAVMLIKITLLDYTNRSMLQCYHCSCLEVTYLNFCSLVC